MELHCETVSQAEKLFGNDPSRISEYVNRTNVYIIYIYRRVCVSVFQFDNLIRRLFFERREFFVRCRNGG